MEEAVKNELMDRIKKKAELTDISDEVVLEAIEKYVKKNDIRKKQLCDYDKKIIIKEIRAELRLYTGEFQRKKMEREKILTNWDVEAILQSHISTKERIKIYPKIREIIDGIKPLTVLDLGCGINPIALAKPGIKYYALDIKKDDLELIKEFFRKEGISGETILFDIRHIRDIELPKCDLCIIFKLFDVVEKNGHKIAEEIISKIRCKYFLISFSTKTLSGKPMNHPQRGWIERLLKRKDLEFKCIKEKNEIFYFVKNKIT